MRILLILVILCGGCYSPKYPKHYSPIPIHYTKITEAKIQSDGYYISKNDVHNLETNMKNCNK